ncbi:MAG: Ig-like domain-containing protein, partial [Lachnospiraceae bacterium]|nr:Ig-like domain-containing protein [Lachnospiraceae bacterium]
ITAVSNGVTMITAKSNDNNNISASVKVEVVADVETEEVARENIEDGTNPGSVSVETQIPANVKSSITISDFDTSTAKEALDESELLEVSDEGADAKISLYVTPLASVPLTEVDKVNTAKATLPVEEVTEIIKLDMSMFKQVGDDAERLTEIDNPIKIEIAISGDAILNDTTKTRHYFMIDVHNGDANVTELNLNPNTGKLVVERDKFSTLVIGYYDTTNVTNVTIIGDTVTLTEVDAKVQLAARIEPEGATVQDVTWSSSNPAVATVDANGKVTAVANGTTIIKATSNDNEAVYGVKEITVSIPSPCTHTETVVKDAKAATCIADGYTGDTYCKLCGVKISSGTVIKAAGHKYDAGKITKEPTVDAEGVKTYTCTVCGATKTEAIAKLTKPETPAVNVSYHTHIQNIGDAQGVKSNGQMAGTSGQSKRLENIWIKVDGNSNLGIQYSTHCQNYGWMPWSANGEANGTSGESKRLEAIKIQLTGADADKYDVYYRVHAQNYGWLAWVSNGAPSGTAGCSLRLEGIQVVVVKKGEAAPGLDYADVKASVGTHNSQGYINKSSSEIVIPGSETTPNVMYRTHIQNVGWQNWKYNGDMSGTSGRSLRLEGINIKLSNCAYSGGIRYTTHIQNYGWSQGWKS